MSQSLILRPGTRYECHGDGTCCTDIHLLGPLSKREAKHVKSVARKILPKHKQSPVFFHDGIKETVFSYQESGACVFLDEHARCRLHAAVGADEKPDVCRHFPVGAALTPKGMRVTLSHRCPCVSVGESRPLDESRARSILSSDQSGFIAPDVEVGDRVRWRGRNYVTFARYERWERWMLEQLDGSGERACVQEVLTLKPDKLPKLTKSSWKRLGKKLWKWADDESETDGYFNTVRWTSLAMRDKLDKNKLPNRPWSWTFERTLARVPEATSTRRIYGRWLADGLWGLGWTAHGSVYRAVADMAARYVLARRLAGRFEQLGARADVAAAEAVMILDTVSASDPWSWVRVRLAEPPAGRYGTPAHPSRWRVRT